MNNLVVALGAGSGSAFYQFNGSRQINEIELIRTLFVATITLGFIFIWRGLKRLLP